MDMKAYWKKVNETGQRLPEEVWLMSIDNTDKGTHAGAVSVVPRDIAARRLVEQTHRIATDAEIATYKETEAVRLQKGEQREKRRDPRRIILENAMNTLGRDLAAPVAKSK